MHHNVPQLEREQQADLARIEKAITQADAALTSLSARQLSPDRLRKELDEIRDRIVLVVRDVRKNIAKRAAAARTMQESLTKTLRRSSRFAENGITDAKLRANLFTMLESTPTFALLDLFTEAMMVGDIARAESIRFEFYTREDAHLYAGTSQSLFSKLPPCDPAKILQQIDNLGRLADVADKRIAEFCISIAAQSKFAAIAS